MKSREIKRIHRKRRIRVKVKGTAEVPRLCIFRSSKAIYVQLVNDESGRTIVSFDSRMVQGKEFNVGKAAKVGEGIAKIAAEKKISRIVFDRGGYRYHGKVKAVAEGARKGGLKF